MSKTKKSRKVVITGAGDVGASFAYALLQAGLAEEIALIDVNADLVQAAILIMAAASHW
ncbi:MAG: hypothetical protein HQ526_05460 [Actinobacteria bacterium]|nr:hypothetical protein [Actinomycetota bacterium]